MSNENKIILFTASTTSWEFSSFQQLELEKGVRGKKQEKERRDGSLSQNLKVLMTVRNSKMPDDVRRKQVST